MDAEQSGFEYARQRLSEFFGRMSAGELHDAYIAYMKLYFTDSNEKRQGHCPICVGVIPTEGGCSMIFYKSLKFIGLMALLILLTMYTVYASQPKKVVHISFTYTIQEGEQLWTIADRYCPSTMDVRQFVNENLASENYELLKKNQRITGRWLDVLPGDEIRVMYFVEVQE